VKVLLFLLLLFFLKVKFHFLPGFLDFLTDKSFDLGIFLLIRYLLINYILEKAMAKKDKRTGAKNPIETNPCIICLNETPVTKQCDSPCECKPHVHQRCINGWFRLNPNECPICRINYEDMPEEGLEETDLVEEQPEEQLTLWEKFRNNHSHKVARVAFAMSLSYLSFILTRGLLSST
jgi:hypothetical protein